MAPRTSVAKTGAEYDVAGASAAYRSAQEALIERNNIPGGLRLLEELMVRRGLPPWIEGSARADMGTALSMIGRRDEAVAQFEYSLRFQPQRPLTFYNLGLSYGELGRAEEAEAWYLGALRHGRTEKRDQERQGLYNPQHAKFMAGVYNNLGNLVHPQGRVGEAQAFYRSAVSVDPQHAMGYNNLGNTFKEPAKGVVLSDHAAEAGHAYATALALWPTYPECYKNLGNLLKERKEWWSASIAAYRSAVKLLPRERSAFLNLGELLGWLGRAHAANVTYALAVQRGVWAHPQQRPSHFVAGLRGRPWWEPSSLAQITRKLRAGYAALRDEGLALLAEGEEQFLNYHSPALVSGRWSDVTLAMSGSLQPGALRAPRSAKLLASLGPDVNTMVMGSAYFSVQSAGSRLQPHCGPTNTRLRIHVGLSVPDGAAMRVGNETRAWVEGGESLIFDDSFEHEVWNPSERPRLVFIVDAWHPDLVTAEQRYEALENNAQKRQYLSVLERLEAGLPLEMAEDMVADRRLRTIY